MFYYDIMYTFITILSFNLAYLLVLEIAVIIVVVVFIVFVAAVLIRGVMLCQVFAKIWWMPLDSPKRDRMRFQGNNLDLQFWKSPKMNKKRGLRNCWLYLKNKTKIYSVVILSMFNQIMK